MWLRSTKIQVLLYREVRNEILCKTVLHHIDYLSPLLFVLVVDRLNKLILKAKGTHLISELVSSHLTAFIKLHYVDDALIFGHGDLKQVLIIK